MKEKLEQNQSSEEVFATVKLRYLTSSVFSVLVAAEIKREGQYNICKLCKLILKNLTTM